MALVILEREQERAQLEEDLRNMRCTRMVCKFVSVREHLIERCNIFNNTIFDWPEECAAGMWREVYNFSSSREGLASQIDTFVDGKFPHMVDPKDGYPVRDCRDARHYRLLEFIVSIIHLDKPTRVTITIGNTIFGALDGRRPID